MFWIGLLVAPMKLFEWCIFSDFPTKEDIVGDTVEEGKDVSGEGLVEASETSDDSITIDSMNRV